MADIRFNNTIAYAGNGPDILSPLVTSIFDQDLVSFEANNDTAMQLGFKMTRALTPDQKFRPSIGAYEMDFITEGQDFPIMQTGFGKEKGFVIKIAANQIGITKLFMKWIQAAQSLNDADTSVKAEWARLAENILALRRGKVKIMNMEATELFTKGFSITTTAGPGSATAYGQPLFSASQPYGSGLTAGVFSNVLPTINKVFDAAGVQLQAAIDVLKQTRLQNGDRVDSPSEYVLMVSRTLATTARKVLNTPGNQVGIYSGLNSNANQLNQFSFNGNKIRLMELPYLGALKKDGTTVGTENMWFVLDAEGAGLAGAMRIITLYDAEGGAYTNDSNKNSYITLDLGFAVDHFGLESFVVGSQGTVA